MHGNEENMSLESANRAYEILLGDVEGIRNVRNGLQPQLTALLEAADPFFIRYFTGSPQFKNMKRSLQAYAQLPSPGDRTDADFTERIEALKEAAGQLLESASAYIRLKGGEGRNRNERKRVQAANEVCAFARDQLRSLNSLSNHLEDVANEEELLQEEMHNLEAGRNQEAAPDQEEVLNQEAEHNQEVEQEPEDSIYEEGMEAYMNAVLDGEVRDDAELEDVYKENFYTNARRAIDAGSPEKNSCIQYILRILRNMFLPDDETYERLGLTGKHDAEEPLPEKSTKLAKKLMQYMTTREILCKEQEQRLLEEKTEPSLIEIMSEEMEPEAFISLVTETPSFQKALEHLTCAGIYSFAADKNSAELKKLAGKVRAEMPQAARQYLIDLGGEKPSAEIQEKPPVNQQTGRNIQL